MKIMLYKILIVVRRWIGLDRVCFRYFLRLFSEAFRGLFNHLSLKI